MVEESYFDDLDWSCLKVSSNLADVFCWTYGMLGYRVVAPLEPNVLDNATSKAKEIGIRALIVWGALASLVLAGAYIPFVAVVLGVGSKIFRAAGFALQKDGFTHVRGSAPEKGLTDGQMTAMVWNVRGHGGGLHYEYGVVHWKSRIDLIVEDIQKEDPDLIVLQEIYDTAFVDALTQRLGGQFAHFFTHLGANTWGNTSGCMVITKCAVHKFSHADFTNNDWKVNRGFETLEIKAHPDDPLPCARLIATQLTPGKEMKEKRMEQVSQIVNGLAKEKLALPTFFAGSLNVNRDDPEEGAFLWRYLYHSYLDKDPTYSSQLANQWAPIYPGQEESSDFISFFRRNLPDNRVLPVIERNVRLDQCHLVKGFDALPPRSDHSAVVIKASGLKAAKQ